MVSPPGTGQYFGTQQPTTGGAQSTSELLRGAGLAGQDGNAIVGGDTTVYMGPDYADPTDRSGRSGTMTIDQAYNEFYRLDDVQYGRLIGLTNSMLGWDVAKAPDRLQSTWNNAVNGAAAYQKATGTPMGPFQFLQLQVARNERLGLTPGKSGGGGGVRKVIDLTNEMDAEVLIDNALTQQLGREANDEERNTFYTALNKLAARNPVVTTQSGQTGGINKQLVAKQFAEAQPDAAEYAAASQYAQWTQDLLMKDVNFGARSGL